MEFVWKLRRYRLGDRFEDGLLQDGCGGFGHAGLLPGGLDLWLVFYCALLGDNSTRSWGGWKLLACGELEVILGGRVLTEKMR